MIKIDNKLVLMCLSFIILGVVTNTLIVNEHPSIVCEKTNSSEVFTIDIGRIYIDDNSDLNVSVSKDKSNLLNKTV